jgi:hypothetical protein
MDVCAPQDGEELGERVGLGNLGGGGGGEKKKGGVFFLFLFIF